MSGQLANWVKVVSAVPKVGDGATIFWYTDRNAATVIRVSKSGKTAYVQDDHATRNDKNGMSECQDYTYSPNPNGRISRVSLRKDGQWRVAKEDRKVAFGVRNAYHDFSF